MRRIEIVRNGGEGAGFSDHYLRVAAVRGEARHNQVETVNEVAPETRLARTILAAEKPEAHALPDAPFGGVCAKCFHAADYFMAGNARKRQSWVLPADGD